MRNPADVSPWAMLLVCGYPFIETLFSIYRRISRKLMPNTPAGKRNACTAPFLWVYSFISMLRLSVYFRKQAPVH